MKVIQNFLMFLYKLFTNLDKEILVDKKLADERLSICNKCIMLDEKSFLSKIKGPRCGICGCFLDYKVLFKVEECPHEEQKW